MIFEIHASYKKYIEEIEDLKRDMDFFEVGEILARRGLDIYYVSSV